VWSDYLDEHLGTEGLLSSDKSLRSQGGCQLYRPDKIYTDVGYTEIGECDEHEHKHSNGSYACDERRISEIYEEEGICGTNMCNLRWNPDSYKPPDGTKRCSRKERLNIYVKLTEKLRAKTHTDKIHVYYMFYSADNQRIARNLPHTMIYTMGDVDTV